MAKKEQILKNSMICYPFKFKDLQSLLFYYYLDRLFLLSMSIFQWDNLPKNCNNRFIELSLVTNATVCFYPVATDIDGKATNFMNFKVIASDMVNDYEESLRYTLVSVNSVYSGKQVERDKIALCWNNYLRKPIYQYLKVFAARLAASDITRDINKNSMRTPVAVRAKSVASRLSMLNASEQYDSGLPYVFVSDEFSEEDFKALNLNTPNYLNDLREDKKDIYREALEFIGIANLSFEKKERMNLKETELYTGYTNWNCLSGLLARQECCQEFNEKFTPEKPLSVRIRNFNELAGIAEQIENDVMEGGEE